MAQAEQKTDQDIKEQLAGIPIYGAPEGEDARILAGRARELAKEQSVLLHVALDDKRSATLAELLHFFAPDIEIVEFPAWDCLPYDRVSPHSDITARRIASLQRLLAWQGDEKYLPRIVLTTVNAALQRVMPIDALQQASLVLHKTDRLSAEDLQSFTARNGYIRTDTVREQGEYAVRGGIIDIYPAGAEYPIRLDLFGDEIESLKNFDPITQMTQGALEECQLAPVSEFFLDPDSVTRFRAGYREAFGVMQSDDPLYESVSEGRRYNGMDHWLPLFHETMDTIFEYIPNHSITMDMHSPQAREERLAQIHDFYASRKSLEQAALSKSKSKPSKQIGVGSVYHPIAPKTLYVEEQEWEQYTSGFYTIIPFSSPHDLEKNSAHRGRDFSDIRALPDGDVLGVLKDHIKEHQDANHQVFIACYSEGSKERLQGLLKQADIGPLSPCENYDDIKRLNKDYVGLGVLGLEQGFVSEDLTVLTEQDILGDRLARRSKRKKMADNFLTEISSLDEGDLVVHVDHGIGRFEGLETLEAAGMQYDCLKVVYAGDDRLFVPVVNMEVLSRFGADEGTVQLDKLGGAGWQARKASVKKNLLAMADELLKIAAARELQKGESIKLSDEVYNEFSARFPYHETDDQLRAITDVVEDLASGRPMDRLVCGDVGFGKTEVALRAAYVAAMEGKQVAIVAPTTLLVRQHFQTFKERFVGTGIRIAMLSRLTPSHEAKVVREELTQGLVDIVIGTHALLGKSVSFKDLGLLVVDEEQRFGVKQKERLKELKANVHILTLTATPIPRTLQLSLTGVKDMSIIATPPVDRLAIRTFVLPYDPMVIREALMREFYRGGQSFYVCPRIKDMPELEKQLKELVPEIKVVTAHGQMSPTDLEQRMSAFYDKEYDLLLATNIIEAGLDIPSANTMIIHRADMLGLAQMYQMRGRIGRSKVRAYAYLTYPPGQKLTPQAQKRLEVIETLDTLGSGFQLASHDMDIRGAGNLLGEEQSGHVKEVGVELYQQMLEEAVAAAKAGVDLTEEGLGDQWSPQISVGTSVLIPETYVEDLSIRMSLYRRLADLESKEDTESFAAELIDRFGSLPSEVDNLLDIVAIKQLCKQAGLDHVEAGPKGAILGFYKDAPPNLEGLMQWVSEYHGAVKLRPDNKIAVRRQWEDVSERVKSVQALLRELITFMA